MKSKTKISGLLIPKKKDNLSSGIYFVKNISNDFSESRKVILLK
jgi:hypothetical protein